MIVKVYRLKKNLKLPEYQHKGDSGVDLVNSGQEFVLKPFERRLVPTGIKVAVPGGYELQVRPRSGLALNRGLTVLNAPGTIDSGYRGEIGVILYNASRKPVRVKKGERIAQAVLCKVEKIDWQVVKKLPRTSRNSGGFGSTG